jgi:threonine dehydratase
LKRQATADYGAVIVGCEAGQREAVALSVLREQGGVMIPPFDHADIIAGQGTATAEFIEQTGPLEALLVPVGGGGLIAGSALAAKHLCPSCRVIGVEPESGDDATRSFRTRSLHTVEHCLSIADGTRTRSLGKLNFQIILRHVDEFVTVSEGAIMDAVRFLFFRAKLVVEPSGALGVAALLSGAWQGRGRVGVILSGGNVDAPTMTQILATG